MTRPELVPATIILLAFPVLLSAQVWAPLTSDLDLGVVSRIAADETGHLWLYGVSGELYSLAPGEDRVEIVGPTEGAITSLQARTDHLLAIMARPSGYSLEQSLDHGVSWSSIELTLPDGSPVVPKRILVDSDGRRYIACTYGNLFQELPGTKGAEWRFYTQRPYMNSDSFMEVSSLSGSDGSLVLTVIDRSLSNGGVVNDVLLEGPRGEWRSISPTDNMTADWSVVRTSDGRLLVAAVRYSEIAPGYVSRDSGKSWSTLEVNVKANPYEDHIPFAANDVGSVVYMTGDGLQYSNDNGETFRRIEAPGFGGYCFAGPDGRLRAHLFWLSGYHAFYEEDESHTTMVLRLESPVLIREDLLTTKGHIRMLMDHPRSDGLRWYALSDQRTIYERTSSPFRWLPLPVPPTDSVATMLWSEDDLYVGGAEGLYRRDNDGAGGWTAVVNGPVERAVVGPEEVAVIDDGSGVLTYYDLANGTLAYPPAESPAADQDVRLIGTARDGSLAIVGERGVSVLPLLSDRWRTISLLIPSDQIGQIDVSSDSLVAYSRGAEISASNDAGTTWRHSTLDAGPVVDLAFGRARISNGWPFVYDRLVALTPHGIWNSDDSGASWTSIVHNLPTSEGFSAFAFGSDGSSSFVAIDDYGIWYASVRTTSSVRWHRSEGQGDLQVHLRDRLLRLVVPGYGLRIEAYDLGGRALQPTIETTEGATETHGSWTIPLDAAGPLLLRVRSSEGEWVVKVVL